MAASRWGRWITTAAVLLLALIAAVVSYSHMYELALRHGAPAWRSRLFSRSRSRSRSRSVPVSPEDLRRMIAEAGLSVTARLIVPEGDGAHALFWARHSPAG